MVVNRRRFLRYLSALIPVLLAPPARATTVAQRHTREIPSSGERIPVIGLGSWLTFGIDPGDKTAMSKREQVMRQFLQAGGGMLDSSPMYGNAEEVIGRFLKNIGHHQGLFAATKVWTQGNRAGLLQMEQSRSLWGIPRIDLMQIHNLLDWETHLPSLQAMKQNGEIRYIGVTTSHGRRHPELMQIMKTQTLDFVQFTYNMLDREAEQYLLPLAAERGLAVIINRPFQRGGLFAYVGRKPLPDWASEIDCDNWAQFFLKFIVSHPAVTCVIPATSRADHLQQNMQAAYGVLPDAAMRDRMLAYVKSL
ncbi:MAG: aldo/keto reductase [Gammaproteobacteria bacterium]|nr:MAG: aldo/keto reductase [Gammaproteobacteria bacterium]